MLKWIGGIALVLTLLVIGTCWYGYNTLTGGGDTASVHVAVSAERGWAYISDPDSMAVWYESTAAISPRGKGPLVVGDTLRVRTTGATPGSTQETSWIVEAIDAPRRISYMTPGDSTMPILRREDAIIPGPADSIAITSRIIVPDLASELPDSVRAGAGRIVETTGKLMTAAMRLAEQGRLERLKAHLEKP
jgi:hypothetical protein